MAYQQVNAQFATANTYAANATSLANGFINSLNAVMANLSAPDIEVEQDWPIAPTLAAQPVINITPPGFLFPIDNTGPAPEAPDTSIVVGTPPSEPSLTDYSYTALAAATRPADVGALQTVALPSAPGAWTAPTPPTLLNFSIRAFEGVNQYGEFADMTAPDDLVLAAPAPFVYVPPTPYQSQLMATVLARVTGGTGIAPEVEQAIWDRSRSREAASATASQAEVLRNAEARGFSLPTGAMHAQMREAQKAYYDKESELSRDIAIKQAELEQANAKQAIDQGIQIEGQLVQYINNIEQRAFDAARYLAQNAVEVYNALVTQYRANLEKYTASVAVFRTLIESERLKVDSYRAEIDAESAKVDINKAAIDQYRALIDLRNIEISLYEKELQAAQVLLSTDKLKIEAFAERIRAYVAEVGAEAVNAEAFKAKVGANQAAADTYRTRMEAYTSNLKATSDVARAKADVYDSEVRGYAARTQAYGSRVSAEAEKVRAQVNIGQLEADVAKAQVSQALSTGQLQIESYRAQVAVYEANKQIALQQAKVLSDNYFALRGLVADASKVAAQVNAQLAASAYGTIQANASISGSDSTNTGFNYSGKTSDERSAPYYA